MARSPMLFIDPARLPDRAALQAALQALRLGPKLDGDWPSSPTAAHRRPWRA